MVKVSVILPIYNVAPYLDETFQSLINQSLKETRNMNCYLAVIDELFKFQDSSIIRKFAKYTLSKVFYTAHQIPFKEKFGVYWRAIRSGYIKYIGLKSSLVFWLK